MAGLPKSVSYKNVQSEYAQGQSNLYKFLQKFGLEEQLNEFLVMGASESDPSELQFVDASVLENLGLGPEKIKKFFRSAKNGGTGDDEGGEEEDLDEETLAWKILETADGLSYYYNELTLENTWERPRGVTCLNLEPIKMNVSVAGRQAEVAEDEADQDTTKLDEINAELREIEKHMDEATGWNATTTAAGLTYYYNLKTGETTWERPRGFHSDAVARSHGSDGAGSGGGETGGSAEALAAEVAADNEAFMEQAEADKVIEAEHIRLAKQEKEEREKQGAFEPGPPTGAPEKCAFVGCEEQRVGDRYCLPHCRAGLADAEQCSQKDCDAKSFRQGVCEEHWKNNEVLLTRKADLHAMLRKQQLGMLVTAERKFIKRLDRLFEVYLGPIDNKLGMLGGSSRWASMFSSFIKAMTVVRGFHRAIQQELAAALGSDDEERLLQTITNALEEGYESVYVPLVASAAPICFSLDKEDGVPKKLQAFLNNTEQKEQQKLLELWSSTKHKPGTTCPNALPFTGMLDLPLQRVHQYAGLLLKVKSFVGLDYAYKHSLTNAVTTAMGVIKALEETRKQSVRRARLDLLGSRVTSIPDGWSISAAGRVLVGLVSCTYIFDGKGLPGDSPPTEHPASDHRGESVQLFLFTDCILLTTFGFKYRFRLDLDDLNCSTGHELLLIFTNDLQLHLEDKELGASADDKRGSSTCVMFDTQHTRNEWFGKAQRAIMLRRSAAHKEKLEAARVSEKSEGGDENEERSDLVNVFLRLRPFVNDEEKETGTTCVTVEGSKLAILCQSSVNVRRADRTGMYDLVLDTPSTQADVFETIGTEALGAILSGYNLALMAYGNTGAGKTYTMFGDPYDEATKGLVPRMLGALFEKFQEVGAYKKWKVEVSYVQVYNNQVQDLQSPKQPLNEIQIKHSGGKIRLPGLVKTKVGGAGGALQVFVKGNKKRSTRAHAMNEVSSRSHAIFIMEISSQRVDENNKTIKCHSTVHFVDLAGSENVALTKVTGDAAKEAKEINKSLITLGRVINALNENRRRTKGKQTVVPFRESKLTELMSEVFLKQFVCSLILNASCSPALGQAKQTGKTMAFGDGLKKWGAKDNKQRKHDQKNSTRLKQRAR